MESTPARRLVSALLISLITLGPANLLAQDAPDADSEEELVTPSDAQQDYNDQGVVLIQDAKYKQAIASFRSSLSLGELNITYLNLGRAYFRLERCLEAREAYDAVKTAPKVKAPTPDEIKDILARFESEYSETCTGTVAISCEGDPMISVGDQPARMCSEVSAWPVAPGTYAVTATYDTGEVTEEVTVEGRSAAAVKFEKPEAVVETTPDPNADPVTKRPTETVTPTYVWVVLGAGAAILAGSLVWDLVVVGGQLDELEDLEGSTDGADVEEAEALRDDIDMNQTITLVGVGVGAATVVVGGLLWLFTGEEVEAETAVGPWIREDGAGVVWQGRF